MHPPVETFRGLHPFDQLRELERQTLRIDVGEQVQIAALETWSALVFRIRQWRLLVRLEELTEIVRVPELTRVPGGRAWIRGVTNLRGTIVTVVDLAVFFGNVAGGESSDQCMLVFTKEGWSCGLLVDEVVGIRTLSQHDAVAEPERNDMDLRDHLRQGYRSHGYVWHEFVPLSLLNDTRFLAAAS